jgi:ubiquinone/menaquinone biosynthesis C-methylase UbiE
MRTSTKVFDQYAKRYDSWYQRHPVLFECEAKVVEALNLQDRGLSIGVGTGILDSKASIKVGMDPALNMLKVASSRGIELVRAVAEYLPFREGSFDFALMTVTLCFLDSTEKAFLEARRILRSSGELAVCIIPKDSTWGEEYMKKAEAGHVFYRYAHFYKLSELEGLLRKCSFEKVAIKATLSIPPSEKPRVEEPSENPEGKGFVCIKAVKL